jgi:hypothetical protein
VFSIVDNGSSNRRAASVARPQSKFRHLTLVPGPVHASWLNQIEIYFSIIQRKVLSPNGFSGLEALAERLLDLQCYGEATAKPFEWEFTRSDLLALLWKCPARNRVAA